ncbi:MAG TPA: hypothetical protein VGB96_00470 [Archangium sp.]
MTRAPLLVLSAALLAGLTGAATPAPRQAAPFTGRWTYTATELRMRDGQREVLCGMSGVTLQLQQRDSLLIGTSSGGTLRCEGRPDRPVTDAPISNGVVRHSDLAFKLGPFTHRGHMARRDVAGAISIPGRPVTGRFTLVRR